MFRTRRIHLFVKSCFFVYAFALSKFPTKSLDEPHGQENMSTHPPWPHSMFAFFSKASNNLSDIFYYLNLALSAVCFCNTFLVPALLSHPFPFSSGVQNVLHTSFCKKPCVFVHALGRRLAKKYVNTLIHQTPEVISIANVNQLLKQFVIVQILL